MKTSTRNPLVLRVSFDFFFFRITSEILLHNSQLIFFSVKLLDLFISNWKNYVFTLLLKSLKFKYQCCWPHSIMERGCVFWTKKQPSLVISAAACWGCITIETQQRAVCFTIGDNIAVTITMFGLWGRLWWDHIMTLGGCDFRCVMGWVLALVGNPMGGPGLCSSR